MIRDHKMSELIDTKYDGLGTLHFFLRKKN